MSCTWRWLRTGARCFPARSAGAPARRTTSRALPGSERLILPASLLHHRTGAAGRCPDHGVKRAAVPWARPGSRFTLLFEHAALVLVREMPVLAAARFIGITDKRLWRIVDTRSAGPTICAACAAARSRRDGVQAPPQLRHRFIDMDRRDKPSHLRHARQGQGLCGRVPGLHAGPWRRTDRGRRGRVRHVAGVPGGGGRVPKRRPHRRLVPCRPAVHNRRRPSAQGRGPSAQLPQGRPLGVLKASFSTDDQISRAQTGLPTAAAYRAKEMLRWTATPRHAPDGASPDSSTISVRPRSHRGCSIPSERRSAPSPRTSMHALDPFHGSKRWAEAAPVTRRYRHLRHHHTCSRPANAARHLQIA